MMKIFTFTILILAISFSANSEEQIDQSVLEFSQLMGLQSIIDSTLEQTRNSMNSTLIDMLQELKKQYPDLTETQNKMLESILEKYVETALGSIDAEKAVYIYAEIISKGMTKKEIEEVSEFYKSPEGKNMQKVVGDAANKLSSYMLAEITAAVKIAQAEFVKDLINFKAQVSSASE